MKRIHCISRFYLFACVSSSDGRLLYGEIFPNYCAKREFALQPCYSNPEQVSGVPSRDMACDTRPTRDVNAKAVAAAI